ncbi:MAG TPA: hypothetical protein VK549_00690 [Acidimicrobiia bacterium]|nr:hypothetical protein [Acidimicrobiia bacterium]
MIHVVSAGRGRRAVLDATIPVAVDCATATGIDRSSVVVLVVSL